MESNIGEDGGSNAVQDVIQRLAGIDQVDLLPSIGDQDQPRSDKRRDPPHECNFHRALWYGGVQAKLRQDARHSGRKWTDRKSTRLNSSHVAISYAVFCLKKKKTKNK